MIKDGHGELVRREISETYHKKLNLAQAQPQSRQPAPKEEKELKEEEEEKTPEPESPVKEAPRNRSKILVLGMPQEMNRLDEALGRMLDPSAKERLAGIELGLGLMAGHG